MTHLHTAYPNNHSPDPLLSTSGPTLPPKSTVDKGMARATDGESVGNDGERTSSTIELCKALTHYDRAVALTVIHHPNLWGNPSANGGRSFCSSRHERLVDRNCPRFPTRHRTQSTLPRSPLRMDPSSPEKTRRERGGQTIWAKAGGNCLCPKAQTRAGTRRGVASLSNCSKNVSSDYPGRL